MPPFIPKKRVASSPPPSPKPTPVKRTRLADVLDAEARNTPGFERRVTFSLSSDDSDSSLSDVDSDQSEDLAQLTQVPQKGAMNELDGDSSEDDDFEDVELHHDGHQNQQVDTVATGSKGPLQLKFDVGDEMMDYSSARKKEKQGPSKREKEVRIRTHQLHVRYLLWHNAVRNRWICDRTVQQTLLAQLPSQIKKEVEKWRRASGLPDNVEKPQPAPQKRKKGRKGKPINPREERDWGRSSEKLDIGKADMSRGDPLISLLKILVAYWRKRFAITAPGLRKRGYGTKLQLRRDVESYRNEKHDPEKHGERIRNVKEFRETTKNSEGSRDVGAQLFTALLRGLGIESRLVASLQPAGYGWTKVEQMTPRTFPLKAAKAVVSDSSEGESENPPPKPKSNQKGTPSGAKKRQPTRKAKGDKDTPIDLDSEEGAKEESDNDSVLDVTPLLPKQRPAKYDRDLPFPIYWTEAISPITNQVIPVDPLVLDKPVATSAELVANFEPRGAKAENVRLVIAYVIAYSDDGTAKDVTVRYLRKHIWPGKTKPFRFPVEKLPIYDRTGRIKRYEDSDWFKYIMSGYVRTDTMRTPVDDIEESTELVPQLPEKKDIDASIDTLQSLKASADFVLERFLRREEALRPEAKPVRTFVSGKGDNLKSEPVYRRADVERCLTTESWHKEGRIPKHGEEPLKMVPVRAVTLTRKREAEEHERSTGMKQLQGLYSWDQTEYIIPPPIENGIIPKNSYGNIDCFVPSMVPKGAVHIPLRGTVRICKRLEVDYAEAVVGFEFGNKRAVPVVNGVVVPKEQEKNVRKAWKEWNDEQKKKEAVKQEKLILDLWRKFVMGLRIRERVGEMYGEELGEGSELQVHSKKRGARDEPIDVDEDDVAEAAGLPEAGGFELADNGTMGGGFLLSDEEDHSEEEDLVIEQHHHHPEPRIAEPASRKSKGKEKILHSPSAAAQYPTPSSESAMGAKVTLNGKAESRLRRDSAEGSTDNVLSDLPDSANDAVDGEGVEHDSEPMTKDGQVDGGNDISSQSDSHSDSDSGSSSVSSLEDEEDEEDYLPIPSSRRGSKPTTPASTQKRTRKSTQLQPRSVRATRSSDRTSSVNSNVKVIVDTPNDPTSTPSRRSIRHPQAKGASTPTSTVVTSPYFKSGSRKKK